MGAADLNGYLILYKLNLTPPFNFDLLLISIYPFG